jgi:hypothetical protein
MAKNNKSSARWSMVKEVIDVSVTLAAEFIKAKAIQTIIVGALGIASQWAQIRSEVKAKKEVGNDRRVEARSTRLGRRGRRHTDQREERLD